MQNRTTRTRALGIGAPAAVIGTVAAALTSAPAEAAQTTQTTAFGAVSARTGAEGGTRVLAPVKPFSARAAAYVVGPGDTVSTIAARHGLRTEDVLSWNGLSWRSVIYPGQKLTLVAPATTPAPAPAASAGTVHTVVAGDTVFAIARKHGTSTQAIIAANGLGAGAIIYPGQKLKISGSAAPAASPAQTAAPAAAPSAATHTVTSGDTLFGIAQKHGTTLSALYAANGLSAQSIIYPGQVIRLAAAPAAQPAASAQKTSGLDAEQQANARRIIQIGRELGVSDRGIAIALATAMVESWLRNLDWGDRDSLGLFQQRPSQGWGTAEQIRDVDRSIRVFYGGPHDPNGTATRGLLDFPDWQSRSFSGAAQAVQISAYPDRYGQWEQQAYRWLAELG